MTASYINLVQSTQMCSCFASIGEILAAQSPRKAQDVAWTQKQIHAISFVPLLPPGRITPDGREAAAATHPHQQSFIIS